MQTRKAYNLTTKIELKLQNKVFYDHQEGKKVMGILKVFNPKEKFIHCLYST